MNKWSLAKFFVDDTYIQDKPEFVNSICTLNKVLTMKTNLPTMELSIRITNGSSSESKDDSAHSHHRTAEPAISVPAKAGTYSFSENRL